MTNQLYMNPKTGSVDIYDGWFYEKTELHPEDPWSVCTQYIVNAVDENEVVEVIWDPATKSYIEAV